jgi:hypothetical protein
MYIYIINKGAVVPISKKNFLKMSKEKLSLRERVEDFLKNNNKRAFSVKEMSSVSSYLYVFEKEGRVLHNGNFWLYNVNHKESQNPPMFFKKTDVSDGSKVWYDIRKFLEKNKSFELLSHSSRGQPFYIDDVNDSFIKIRFSSSMRPMKIGKCRFISAYNLLKEQRKNWVKIGASRVGTDSTSLEGRIKRDCDGSMDSLSTATWVAAILVKVFDNIIFNGKRRGQALMMK